VQEIRSLVVGGAGYIGSHMVRALADAGCRSVVLDNFSTGHRDAVTGEVVEGAMQDAAAVERAVRAIGATSAMHFASFIRVDESVADPQKYFANNVGNTERLLDRLVEMGVRQIVFSSSAAVYGEPRSTLLDESHPMRPVNPYGESKLQVERMLARFERERGLRWVALRYFNAAGAHPDGTLGERHDPETHLIPLALQAANGRRGHLTVYGTDYPTPDGTCVRDYVHVCDLADAHLLALDYLARGGECRAFNLGNAGGFSVREVTASVERVTGQPVPVSFGPRRPGDPAVLVADASQARRLLGWNPRFPGLDTIVAHAWGWERRLAAAARRSRS